MTPKRWVAAACAAGFLVFLCVLWLVQGALSQKKLALELWREKVLQIRVLTKDGRVIPSLDTLRSLERERLTFQSRLDQLLDALNTSGELRLYESPLEFKGDLFKLQRATVARAASLSIPVPPDIGFKEFTGKEIPASAELEGLSFQLAKTKELLEILLDCPVAEIRELRRGPVDEQRIEPDEEIAFYRDCTLRVDFVCSAKAFGKFLEGLQNSNSIFLLESMDIRLRSPNLLELQATLRAVSFSKTREA